MSLIQVLFVFHAGIWHGFWASSSHGISMAFAKKMMGFPSDLVSFSTKLPSRSHEEILVTFFTGCSRSRTLFSMSYVLSSLENMNRDRIPDLGPILLITMSILKIVMTCWYLWSVANLQWLSAFLLTSWTFILRIIISRVSELKRKKAFVADFTVSCELGTSTVGS